MKTYQEYAQERIKETMPKIERAIQSGMSVTDAINRNASDNDSYNHALRHYGLKPHLHD